MRVGRDYFGGTIHGVPASCALENQLAELYPSRFKEPLKRGPAPALASGYIFSFLEASIARCGRSGDYDEQDRYDI